MIVEKHKKFILIKSEKNLTNIGIVFYSGARINHNCYIPMFTKVAEYGYTVFLVKMPFKLAVFGVNSANHIIKNQREITIWYICGHSLGGAMAGNYVNKNNDKIKGIILLGSYVVKDLKNINLKAISIHGKNDKVLNMENFGKNKVNLPINTKFIELDGANHSYFGDYGEQKGDGLAQITREEQQNITVQHIVDFIQS